MDIWSLIKIQSSSRSAVSFHLQLPHSFLQIYNSLPHLCAGSFPVLCIHVHLLYQSIKLVANFHIFDLFQQFFYLSQVIFTVEVLVHHTAAKIILTSVSDQTRSLAVLVQSIFLTIGWFHITVAGRKYSYPYAFGLSDGFLVCFFLFLNFDGLPLLLLPLQLIFLLKGVHKCGELILQLFNFECFLIADLVLGLALKFKLLYLLPLLVYVLPVVLSLLLKVVNLLFFLNQLLFFLLQHILHIILISLVYKLLKLLLYFFLVQIGITDKLLQTINSIFVVLHTNILLPYYVLHVLVFFLLEFEFIGQIYNLSLVLFVSVD